MISTAQLIARVDQLTKDGTSGYSTQEEKNSDLFAVQYEVLGLLCDNYERNQKVSDSLINHVKFRDIVSNSNGVLGFSSSGSDDYVDDYYRTLSILLGHTGSAIQYPATKVNINEIAMYKTSPIRKMVLADNRVGYYFADGEIIMLPETQMDVCLVYCKKPALAEIVYTSSSDEDNDYLEVDELETIDLEFPENLFNLFTYLLLEKRGIEMKDQLSQEYSQLGITRTTKIDIT